MKKREPERGKQEGTDGPSPLSTAFWVLRLNLSSCLPHRLTLLNLKKEKKNYLIYVCKAIEYVPPPSSPSGTAPKKLDHSPNLHLMFYIRRSASRIRDSQSFLLFCFFSSSTYPETCRGESWPCTLFIY